MTTGPSAHQEEPEGTVVTTTAPGFAPEVTFLDSTPEFYGAKGDGETDDTAAFQALHDAIRESGSGIARLAAKTYIVDGLVLKSAVYWQGRGSSPVNGTILKAKAGSDNPGMILLGEGGISSGGWKGVAFKSAENPTQSCVYFYGEGAGGSVQAYTFEDCVFGSGAPFLANSVWLRGGLSNSAGAAMQDLSFHNCRFSRKSEGEYRTTTRNVKLTGQCSKITFYDCGINGTNINYEGTNIELSREFTEVTTVSAEANPGATALSVASTEGLAVGKIISIGEGAYSEASTITQIAGTDLSLGAPLKFSHGVGQNVYALGGSIVSPTTSCPNEILFLNGAIQTADLQVLVDGECHTVTFDGVDFEAQSKVLRARQGASAINLRGANCLGASTGSTNGTGVIAEGSSEITEVTKAWEIGDKIAGVGIPAGSIVTGADGTTISISNVCTTTGNAKGTVTLIRGSNGDGYYASFEDLSRGLVDIHVAGAADNYVLSDGGGVQFSRLETGVGGVGGFQSVISSGISLTIPTAVRVQGQAAREIVFSDAARSVEEILSYLGTGEMLTLRATASGTTIKSSGNIYLNGEPSIELAAGHCALLLRTDYGPRTWILVK